MSGRALSRRDDGHVTTDNCYRRNFDGACVV